MATAINLGKESIYVKGTVEMLVYDIASNNIIGYSNKLTDANFSSSVNEGAVQGGPGNITLINLPDSAAFTGEVTAQDFSLEARQFQTGGNLAYNGIGKYRESITATGITLTVTGDPVANYGEAADDDGYVSCYVGTDGVNYKVDPATKKVINFTAVEGQTYCVTYFQKNASAQVLTIPAVFSPSVNRVVLKMAAFSAQGNANGKNSSKVANVYVVIPRAQFVGGDAGIDGSQTDNAKTSWKFSALAYKTADATCQECSADETVLGYYVIVPCDTSSSAVKGLVVVGEPVSVAQGKTVQLPVYYLMPDNSLVTPRYADLTYASAAVDTATVSTAGVVTGVAEGDTSVSISITDRPAIKTVASIAVTA